MDTDRIYAEHIASQYAAKETSKVVALRKLDRKAKRPASIFAFTFGIISALVLGIGMCLSMQVIGSGSPAMTVLGVILGLAGLAGAALNCFIYKRILEKSKKKYAFEIMELAKEITGQPGN